MGQGIHTVAGGCMCGAVRYEASGEPDSVIHSNCLSCRRHTGALGVMLAGLRRDQVEFTADDRRIYESSPGVGRCFCGKCGTPLTWEGDGGELGPLIEILIRTADDPNALVTQFHIHHDERVDWFEVNDGLPRYHVWGATAASHIVPVRLLKALRAEGRRGKCVSIGKLDVRTFKTLSGACDRGVS